jgi:hypothetical protein
MSSKHELVKYFLGDVKDNLRNIKTLNLKDRVSVIITLSNKMKDIKKLIDN